MMKLSYRGRSYEPHHSDVEIHEGEIGGHYRGLPWRVHRHKQQACQRTVQGLTYRGVSYKH